MFLVEHWRLHAPQWLTSVLVAISHPSAICPLQFRKPSTHAPPHTPSLHDGSACAGAAHVTPQPPQFVASLVVAASQPSVCLLPLQSAKPGVHDPSHAPPEHAGVM
jgi:hypothetical protein